MSNIIITGCNRGIGKAILEKFASNGWNIWAHMRHKNEEFESYLLNLAVENHIWIKPIYFDLGDEVQIKESMKNIFSEKKEIDVLVNNAGIGNYEIFQRTTIQKARELFEINFFAPYQIIQYCLKKMVLQKRGVIINISSIASLDANSGDSVYGASKAAMNLLTKDLAAEVGKFGIRVNAVAPGPVETEMLERNHFRKLTMHSLLERIALERIATTQDIANVVYFLSTDDASYINGEVIRIDGGRK